MAENDSGVKVLVGFIAVLIVFLTSLVSFGITADVAFYIHAVTDDTLWTEDLKYIDINGTLTNEYGVDDANLKDTYEAAADARTDNLGFLTLVIAATNLVVTLISLVIVIGLFFRKDGILDMIKGTSK